MVAQPDRVREALEADRVLVEARDRQHARDRSERDDQLVVAKLVLDPLLVAHRDRAARGVAADGDAQPQPRLAQDVAKRGDDVARLERPGRGLRQEGRVEEEVDVVDERDAGALGRHRALELAGGVVAAEATADDDDVPGHELIVSAL